VDVAQHGHRQTERADHHRRR